MKKEFKGYEENKLYKFITDISYKNSSNPVLQRKLRRINKLLMFGYLYGSISDRN